MTIWTKHKLGSTGRVITGKTPPTNKPELYGDLFPFITPTDILESSIHVYTPERYLSNDGAAYLESSRLPQNAICYTCIASVGKVIITVCDSFTNQQINSIVVDSTRHNFEFLYYLLKHKTPQIKFIAMAGGVASPIINKEVFENIEINVPNLLTQQRIAAVLSTHDNLIENNEKRIRVLEEMLQFLYTEWFVRFKFPGYEKVKMVDSGNGYGMVPEGWEVVEMRSIAKIIDCLHTKKPEEIKTGNNRLLQLNNILDNGVIDLSSNYFISDEDYERWTSNIELQEGDCVVTNVGRIAASAQIPHGVVAAAGRNMTVIRPEKVPASFLIQYLHSVHMEREVAKKTDSGAIMGSLNVKNIYLLRVLIPKKSILEQFSNLALVWRNEMNNLYKENLNLSKTRDILIPQLVTGKRELK